MINKKTINLSQGQPKRPKVLTSAQNKSSNKSSILVTKLATETYDRSKIPVDHKYGIDKIFNKLKMKDTNKEQTGHKTRT